METTFIMIKPDGVQRCLIAPCPRDTLRGLKFLNVSKELAKTHYSDLSSNPFFPALIEYIISGPVVAIALEGENVVAAGRRMLGATNPQAAEIGTIRGDYCIFVGRNVCHGSGSVESAQKELALWFPEGLVDNSPVLHNQIYE